MSEKCLTCGQRVVKGNIAFGKMFAKILWLAQGFSRDLEAVWKMDRADKDSPFETQMVQRAFLAKDFLKPGIPVGLYNNLSKLKHWGLTRQSEKWWHQGIYQLTNEAVAFMRGRIKIHKELTVSGDVVLGRSPEFMSYQEAWGKAWPEIADHIATWRRGQDGPQGELF